MAATGGMTWRDRVRKAFAARDEGELENVINDLPENAELHLHVGGNGNGTDPVDNGGMVLPGMMDAALKIRDAELEEIWRAIGNVDKTLAKRVKAFRRSGDARFKAPQRDARRARLGIRDEDSDEDGKSKTDDNGDDDDDDDDKKKSGDEFRDPPEANAGGGNRPILPGFRMEAPPGTADSAFRTADSAYLKDSGWMMDSFHESCAIAEVLIPGVRMPEFDAAARPQKTFDALCGFRSKVVDLAWAAPATRELIEDVTGGRFTDVKAMDCKQVRDLFLAIGALRMRLNDAAKGSSRMPFGGPNEPISSMTLADLQKANAQFYAGAAKR